MQCLANVPGKIPMLQNKVSRVMTKVRYFIRCSFPALLLKLADLVCLLLSSDLDTFLLFSSDQTGRPPCPMDPFFIMPDKCKCVDFQVLKLQESPDAVPNGEMPRHMQLYCDR